MAAHRLARNRPAGHVATPPVAQLESIADPKRELEDQLSMAAGPLTGRRAKKFKGSLVARRVNVANLIEDFSPLEELPAFRRYQEALRSVYPYLVD